MKHKTRGFYKKGGEKMKVKKIVIEAEDEVKKDDTVETPAEEKVEQAPVEETAETTEETKEEKTEETPVEGEAEGEKTEETPEETKETTEEETPAEEKTEEGESEAKAEEAEAEKPEEEVKEVADKSEMQKSDDKEIVVKLDFSDFKEQFEKMVSPIMEKVDALTDKVDGISKAAPAEGAADTEETPEENAEKSDKTEDASKEEVNKSDTSSEGADNSAQALLLKTIEELKARLTKVESQPAPSKVVVVSKDGNNQEVSELQKVTDRLAEIEKARDADPATYMRNTALVDEALTLVEQKRKLMGGK